MTQTGTQPYQDSITLLNFNLSSYGLKPSDWTIEMISSHLAFVKNKHSEDFSFLGQLKESRLEWKSLELYSI